MDGQPRTPNEQALFDQELEQNLRNELPAMREEEIKAAARRAAAREVAQQRDALRDNLDDEVVAITEEPADLRAAANRQAPSKVLLGVVLLLLLLFTLAVFGRLPGVLAAFGAGATQPAAGTNNISNAPFEAVLGTGAGGGTPTTGVVASAPAAATPEQAAVSETGTPVATASPSPAGSTTARVQVAMLPHTGKASNDPVVDPLFGHVYWQQGGVQRFGLPIGPLTIVDGQQTQTFEHARFRYRPEHAGAAGAVHIEWIK